MNTHSLPPPDSDVLIITVKGGGGAVAARRRRGGTADGRMLDLVPAGANFCPLQFPKFQKRCRNGGGARGACDRVRTCEEGNQGVDGTMGREGSRRGRRWSRSFVRYFFMEIQCQGRPTSDGDVGFLSHETRSKFAIAVIVVTRPSPARLFLCHCSRKSNASFPAAAARLDVACTRAPADCRYADVP